MVVKQLVSNLWLWHNSLVFPFKRMTVHSCCIIQTQETMKHKLLDLAHTLTVYVSTVKDGVTSIFMHPMIHSFRLCLCLLWDLVTISLVSLVVTYPLLTQTLTSEIHRCEAKVSKQHHLLRIKLGELPTLFLPSRCQMLMKFQSTGSQLILPRPDL